MLQGVAQVSPSPSHPPTLLWEDTRAPTLMERASGTPTTAALYPNHHNTGDTSPLTQEEEAGGGVSGRQDLAGLRLGDPRPTSLELPLPPLLCSPKPGSITGREPRARLRSSPRTGLGKSCPRRGAGAPGRSRPSLGQLGLQENPGRHLGLSFGRCRTRASGRQVHRALRGRRAPLRCPPGPVPPRPGQGRRRWAASSAPDVPHWRAAPGSRGPGPPPEGSPALSPPPRTWL